MSSGANGGRGVANFYVALFNLSDDPHEVSVSVAEVHRTLFAASSTAPCANATTHARDVTCAEMPATFAVRDLWQHKETSTIKSDEVLSAKLAPHASLLVKITEER